MIHGRLLQDGTLVPLANASVQLMDASGNELNRLIMTNEAGTFAMRVEPGRYTLRIRRIGFTPLTTPVISLAADEYRGDVRVSGHNTAGDRRIREGGWMGRDSFSGGQELGGIFLTGKTWRRKITGVFVSAVRDRRHKGRRGGKIRRTKGRCLYSATRFRELRPGGPPATQWPKLEELVPTAICHGGRGVSRLSEVPAEFRFIEWPGPGPPRQQRLRAGS